MVGRIIKRISKLEELEAEYEKEDQKELVDRVRFVRWELRDILESGKTKDPSNPIINNRIVSDFTFARRLVNHLDGVEVNCIMGLEEKEYLLMVAKQLLEYQIKTCSNEERDYHKNCDIKFK